MSAAALVAAYRLATSLVTTRALVLAPAARAAPIARVRDGVRERLHGEVAHTRAEDERHVGGIHPDAITAPSEQETQPSPSNE